MAGYYRTPPVVLNLIIINFLVYLAQVSIPGAWGFMVENLALFFPASDFFRPHQLVTYMFLHDNGGIGHLFFNMFSLWMFGRTLEYTMGSRRFLTYYLVCGIGAALFFWLVSWAELTWLAPWKWAEIMVTPTLGASGAVYGLLLAFGMLYSNSVIMLLIPPIPMKAKYFVIVFGLIELLLGVFRPGDSIAHFAHVGGMLWGLALLLWWRKGGRLRY